MIRDAFVNQVPRILDCLMQFVCSSLHSCPLLTFRMMKSRFFQVFLFLFSKQLESAAILATGLTRKTSRRCQRTTCSRARVQSLQNDSRPIIGSVRNTHLRFFVAVWEAAFDTSLVYLFRDTPCGSRLFFSHGKGYWTRTPVTSAIAFRGAHVSAFKEASLDRSKFLGLFSSLQFCFYLFHPGKHCVAQILHRKQAYVLADAAYSPGVSPQRRPYPWVPHWARKRWIGTSGPVKDVYRATALALWCHTASPETEGTVNLREHLTTWKRCCYESRTEARYEHNENGERVVIATTVGA